MRQVASVLATLLLGVLCGFTADKQQPIVVEATVIRVEPWGVTKTPCGTIINFRMAEYRVDTVYKGKIKSGEQIVVRHVACNYKELEELKGGARVILVATPLPQSEDALWAATSLVQGEREHVTVRYDGVKAATVTYSMTGEP